ncbi:MAG: carboxypeptidase regulatory-like domain-containing protein [Kofleriaceae bacterium]
MPNRMIAALVAVAVAIGLGWWWRARSRSPGSAAPATSAAGRDGAGRGAATHEPTTASIAGTITDLGGQPIRDARVCASVIREGAIFETTDLPRCTTTDTAGRYQLAELVPDRHTVTASAATYLPTAWGPAGEDGAVTLAPGEHRAGIDLALRPGGVALRGTVEDVSGGPIVGAVVSARHRGGGTSSTDADGRFVLWTRPGTTAITAWAEGYADGGAEAVAPSSSLRVFLTPASSLAGVVLTAEDRRPVADAEVSTRDDVEGTWTTTRTDAQGRFRLARLSPGRYKPTASATGRFGMAPASTLLGLGQQVDGLEILVGLAFQVTGAVVIADTGAPCPRARVKLADGTAHLGATVTSDAAGRVVFPALQPGHYRVQVNCPGFTSEAPYPAIDVVDADVGGHTWTVAAGARLRGTVATASGAPVEEAAVMVYAVKRTAGGIGGQHATTTAADGSFAVTGLGAGTYAVAVMVDGRFPPKPVPTVEVPAGGDASIDVRLAATGEIAGAVVDTSGQPVRGATVQATSAAGPGGSRAITDDDGGFVLLGVEPGVRRVTATRGELLRKPGPTGDDRPGESVTVVAGQRATVRLEVEAEAGTIAGVVVDEHQRPVADAWLSAARESDAPDAVPGAALRSARWSFDDGRRPVVSDQDGGFRLEQLAPGRYTIRAFRKGGGEAASEHVAVGTRDARLAIAAPGAISGTVVATRGQLPARLTLTVTDAGTGFERQEIFFGTGGAFALLDLPAGSYTLVATGTGARGETTVELAAGAHAQHVTIELAVNTRVTGRFVDLDTDAPIAGLKATVVPLTGGDEVMALLNPSADDGTDVSGADGRWAVANVAPAVAYLWSLPVGGAGPWRSAASVVDARVTTDVGDVPVVRRRTQPGQEPGTLGLDFVEDPPGADPRARVLRIRRVAPGQPAAKAGLKADDVVVAIDGHDVRGARALLAAPLLEVPPGTTIELTLEPTRTVALTAVAAP